MCTLDNDLPTKKYSAFFHTIISTVAMNSVVFWTIVFPEHLLAYDWKQLVFMIFAHTGPLIQLFWEFYINLIILKSTSFL